MAAEDMKAEHTSTVCGVVAGYYLHASVLIFIITELATLCLSNTVGLVWILSNPGNYM